MAATVFFGPMLVIVVSLSTAQTQACCTPDQWEGLISYTDGTSKGERGTLTSTGVKYQLDLKTRKCTVQKQTDPFLKFCFPVFRKVANLTLGTANESLPVVLYEYRFKEANITRHSSLTVTPDLCIPIFEVDTAEINGEIFFGMISVADIKLGISQPSVFTVPPECQSGMPLFADKSSGKFPPWHSLASPYFHL